MDAIILWSQVKLEQAASASRLQYGHSTPITVAALLQNLHALR